MAAREWAFDDYPDGIIDIPEDDTMLTPAERDARARVRASSAPVSSVSSELAEYCSGGVGMTAPGNRGSDGRPRQAPAGGARTVHAPTPPGGVLPEDTDAANALIEKLASVWEHRERRVRRTRQQLGVVGDGGPGFDRGELFGLARRMVAAGVVRVGDLYGGPLEAACVRLGLNVEEVFAALSLMLEEVTTGPETDALAVAMGEADDYTRHFAHPGRSRSYPRVAALAFCLSRMHRPGEWFPMPTERIGHWLGVHRDTAGALIRLLDRDRVIRLRRDESGLEVWNYQTGEAREARYTGPNPAEANP